MNRYTSFAVNALRTSAFEGLALNHWDVDWLISRAILSTKTSRLIKINAKVMSRFPGSYKTFLSADTVE